MPAFAWPPQKGDLVKLAILTTKNCRKPDNPAVKLPLGYPVKVHRHLDGAGYITYLDVAGTEYKFPRSKAVPECTYLPALGEIVALNNNITTRHAPLGEDRLLTGYGRTFKVSHICTREVTIGHLATGWAIRTPCAAYVIVGGYDYVSLMDIQAAMPVGAVATTQEYTQKVFKECTCDLTTLMRTGCACGSVSKYAEPNLIV